ncbi:hypothetical protein [Eubacterium aggregans]|uniref:hypothetical protein n=1 Tax=Eubacterium aggregans TaxID=81409 RepID=UPI003F3F90C3
MTLDQLADFGIEEVFPGTAFSTRGFYLKIPVQGQSFKHLDFKLLVEGMGFGGVTVSSIAPWRPMDR